MSVAGRGTDGGRRVEGRRGPARKLLHHGRGLPAVLAGAQTPGPGARAGFVMTHVSADLQPGWPALVLTVRARSPGYHQHAEPLAGTAAASWTSSRAVHRRGLLSAAPFRPLPGKPCIAVGVAVPVLQPALRTTITPDMQQRCRHMRGGNSPCPQLRGLNTASGMLPALSEQQLYYCNAVMCACVRRRCVVRQLG